MFLLQNERDPSGKSSYPHLPEVDNPCEGGTVQVEVIVTFSIPWELVDKSFTHMRNVQRNANGIYVTDVLSSRFSYDATTPYSQRTQCGLKTIFDTNRYGVSR